ncbi:hypothetical protein CPB85DRAFT_1439789 [Mucidula mucida]|nr:hypothetical protein CPB85DRAFT_1439789 [Mucidula mucida]
MPLAVIDAEGTRYVFTDSGPIRGCVYQTLMIFHDTLFNGKSFEPLVPLFNGVRPTLKRMSEAELTCFMDLKATMTGSYSRIKEMLRSKRRPRCLTRGCS